MNSYPKPRYPPPEQGRSTKSAYYIAYFKWMQKTNHPDLLKSNYNADKFRELQNLKSQPK